MRKTTDPHERKYLIDREFNTFGRGAIEDAPAELLYGKGAIAEGFNVNCYQSYVEGRRGTRVHHYGATGRPSDGYERANLSKLDNTVYGSLPNVSGDYIDWGNLPGDRDVFLSRGGNIVESSTPREGGNAVIRHKPTLMAWHSTLKCWVRIENGRVIIVSANMGREIKYPWVFNANSMSAGLYPSSAPLNSGRVTFIESPTGGFFYTSEGIFRWIENEDDGAGSRGGIVVQINLPAPVMMRSHTDTFTVPDSELRYAYRYLFTGLRMRGKSRLEDPANTIVDFETPTSEHNFIMPINRAFPPESTGFYMRATGGPINKRSEDGSDSDGSPARIYTETNTTDRTDSPLYAVHRTITHIGMYRTLDTNGLDADAGASAANGLKVYNSPNRFALVADLPLAVTRIVRFRRFTDDNNVVQYSMVLIKELTVDDGIDYNVLNAPLIWAECYTPFNTYEITSLLPQNKFAVPSMDTNEKFTIRSITNADEALLDEFLGNNPLSSASFDGNGITTSAYVAYSTAARVVGNLERWPNVAVATVDGTAINNLHMAYWTNLTVSWTAFLSDGEAYGWGDTGNISRPLPSDYLPDSANRSRPLLCSIAVVRSFSPGYIRDDTPDEVLRARLADWYPRTRFCRPLPDCNVAAKAPGFVVCAKEGQNTLYYTADDTMGGYTHGSHNPIQTNDTQIEDGIEHIVLFNDTVSIICKNSTYGFPTGLVEYFTEPGSGWVVPLIPKINTVDRYIGTTFWRTVQPLPNGQIILFMADKATSAVRVLDGHQYGDNLLTDTGLGLSRNKNRARNIVEAIALYSSATGYIVWGKMPPSEAGTTSMIADYCFRLAIHAEEGGGVTEYGGEPWVWPEADGGTVETGCDPDGNPVAIVEDARTGYFFALGLAEQWADKDTSKIDGNAGYQIETRFALPIIADGYKWQKHLETHIAMRCWRQEYRGADGFTADGFKPEHKIGLKIYEDGERVAEESALRDVNRNGDYAYLKKIDARRIQEVIETTTSAYKVSQVVTKVQTSDREALPVNNEPLEVKHQKEWRDVVIHLSRNLPYPTYNRADGTNMGVKPLVNTPGKVGRATAPTNKPGEAFWVDTSLIGYVEETIVDFTVSMWIKPAGPGNLFVFETEEAPPRVLALLIVEVNNVINISCTSDGAELLAEPLQFGVWQHIVLRCKIQGNNGTLSLYVDGEHRVDAIFVPSAQGTIMGIDVSADAGTTGQGEEWQNTVSAAGSISAGPRVTIGQGRSTEYYDVRLVLTAVSADSIKTYYDAVGRGGEGWLP